MAETKAPRQKQSREYKNKTIAQLLVGIIALTGFEVDPEDLAAMLAGIEAGYLIIRRFIRRGEVAA